MALSTDSAVLGVVPDESAILVEVRSSVGLISFGTTALSGEFRGSIVNGEIDLDEPLQASLVLAVQSLTSGRALHDSEMRRRLDAQRYPRITAELIAARPLAPGRFAVTGDLTIHGRTRRLDAAIDVVVTAARPVGNVLEAASGYVVVVSGTLMIDMCDYDVALPSLVMLRVHPEVSVTFRLTVASGG
ncbi:MAG: YceI family protein [Jatrophihabitantaceae bacterium]